MNQVSVELSLWPVLSNTSRKIWQVAMHGLQDRQSVPGELRRDRLPLAVGVARQLEPKQQLGVAEKAVEVLTPICDLGPRVEL